MDLSFTSQNDAFRHEIRDWLTDNVPSKPLKTFDTEEGFAEHREWEKKLYEGRWGMITWPEEFGGRGANLIEWLIFEEEYYRARAPLRVNQNGIFLLGPTLMEYGTDSQKAKFLTGMATGKDMWCQGWSEPSAGSDMAAIKAKAVLSEDGTKYIINGQKTWSTRAVWADMCFGMFRTDPE
ncbi:MAG: acyl-CoA dehydrogenase family protein, partial [Pseudomonadota bacterium]